MSLEGSVVEHEGCNWRIGNLVGRGAYSTVHVARAQNGETLAVKAISLSGKSSWATRQISNETEIWSQLNHPNIVQFRGTTTVYDWQLVFMEKIDGGQLFEQIVQRERFPEKEAALVIHQVASAVKYMHGLGICHRDLKPENILCTSATCQHVKIADFGAARRVVKGFRCTSPCGTEKFQAPEVRGSAHGLSADMWSLGCLAYVLLGGEYPFDSAEDAANGHLVFHEDTWKDISVEAKAFVWNLLRVEPQSRLTAIEALEHPWLMTCLTGRRPTEPALLAKSPPWQPFASIVPPPLTLPSTLQVQHLVPAMVATTKVPGHGTAHAAMQDEAQDMEVERQDSRGPTMDFESGHVGSATDFEVMWAAPQASTAPQTSGAASLRVAELRKSSSPSPIWSVVDNGINGFNY